VTKGETYGMYHWAIDVTVPSGWTEEQDHAYVSCVMGVETKDELINRICTGLADSEGILELGYHRLAYMLDEPRKELFERLPVTSKVALLKALIHERSQDRRLLERFDGDLRRYLDVEAICMPILQRYLLDPESVWLRELVDAHDAIVATFANFLESLQCEFRELFE
jgi:hypothetical protein